MIKELTLYFPDGKKETYEVGREVYGEKIEKIDVEQRRAIIYLKDDVKVIDGIPFEYTAPKWIV